LLLQTQVGVGVTGTPTLGVAVASDAISTPGPDVGDVALGTVQPTGLSPLFAAVTHGDIVMVGNTLRTCAAGPACTAAQTGAGANDGFEMVPVNVDPTGPTASSSATLTLPAGASVNRAWLVWGATTAGASDPIDPSNYGRVRLCVAGGVCNAKNVVATTTNVAAAADVYGRVEVTDFIQTHGSSTYTFGSLGGYDEPPVGPQAGGNRSGGWALIVQYNGQAEPLRTLVVLDGMVDVGTGGHPAPELTLGFLGSGGSATTVDARIGLVAWDGDRGTNDAVVVTSGASGAAVHLADGTNPADDVFNSTVSTSGAPSGGRDPAVTNTLGFDADTLDVTVNGGGALSLRATSASDDVIQLGVITLSVPV
jgi:hypothetical protein